MQWIFVPLTRPVPGRILLAPASRAGQDRRTLWHRGRPQVEVGAKNHEIAEGIASGKGLKKSKPRTNGRNPPS